MLLFVPHTAFVVRAVPVFPVDSKFAERPVCLWPAKEKDPNASRHTVPAAFDTAHNRCGIQRGAVRPYAAQTPGCLRVTGDVGMKGR